MNEVLERRLEFLNLEAKGFSLCEIVKLLSEKYHTTERNIYYDAENRDTWQPTLTHFFNLDKARLVIVNRYDYLYRLASLGFQTASETQKPLYLSRMIDITSRLVTLLGVETVKETQTNQKHHTEMLNDLAKGETMLNVLTPLNQSVKR